MSQAALTCPQCGKGLESSESCSSCGEQIIDTTKIAQERILDCDPKLVVPSNQNPWKVALVDVSSIRTLLSCTKNPVFAHNALSYSNETGEGFADEHPDNPRIFNLENYGGPLRYKRDQPFMEGVLFTPEQMEDKWAIFVVANTIRLVRTWRREVMVVAHFTEEPEFVSVNRIEGCFDELPDDEPPEMTIRMFDFIVRIYALEEDLPAPLPWYVEPEGTVSYCMSLFGNRMNYATWETYERTLPDQPLRTCSKLHIAVAYAERDKVKELLKIAPLDLKCRDGFTPLHWAADLVNVEMLTLLVESGTPVNQPSQQGDTPLLIVCDKLPKRLPSTLAAMEFLLSRRADPDTADRKGWTSLHRAAEVGSVGAVRLLLGHGASELRNKGLTPGDLAKTSGAKATEFLLMLARLRVYFAGLGCTGPELDALWHAACRCLQKKTPRHERDANKFCQS